MGGTRRGMDTWKYGESRREEEWCGCNRRERRQVREESKGDGEWGGREARKKGGGRAERRNGRSGR